MKTVGRSRGQIQNGDFILFCGEVAGRDDIGEETLTPHESKIDDCPQIQLSGGKCFNPTFTNNALIGIGLKILGKPVFFPDFRVVKFEHLNRQTGGFYLIVSKLCIQGGADHEIKINGNRFADIIRLFFIFIRNFYGEIKRLSSF